MGQIVRRKKRGRPSSLDLARRNSPVHSPSPSVRRRSRRCRSVRFNFNIDDYVDDDEEDEEFGRREKKLRLLLFEDNSRSNRRVTHAPSSSSASSSSSSSDDDDDDEYCKPSKKMKLNGEDEEDNEIEEIRVRKLEVEDEEVEEDEEEEGSDSDCGRESDIRKGVFMPDKRTLELILDKLQKKDIYGVYAKPVDPEELPDYHDVIKHPMDFSTVRKKLAKGLYLSLKEFESDVFLICANAMQYNAPDTVYYKQASSIEEQAKLKFQRLREDFDRSEIELKEDHKTTPSFSPPKKQSKNSVVQTSPDPDPVGSESLSGSTIKAGKFPNGSSAQTPVRPNSGQIAENSSLCDNNLDEDEDEELLPGKAFMSELERTPSPSIHDENRRATYNISFEPVPDPDSVFSTFEGESKQFIPVGLNADHSYARSLARFAATLGPVAWKIASQTIKQALPKGVEFGPGWVGEYEPLPTPLVMPETCTLREPNFLSHFKIAPVVTHNEKASQSHKMHVDMKEINDCFNHPQIPIKQESVKEACKDLTPRPPFFPGSNLVNQNSQSRNPNRAERTVHPRVELNHPPPIHASYAADFVAKGPTSVASDISSKTILRNGNLTTVASFNHPNGYNNGFTPGRPNKSVDLDCNRMVPVENNKTPRPVSVASDISSKTTLRNGNLTTATSFKHPNGYNNGFAPGRPNKPVGLDYNRMVPVENNKTPKPVSVASDISSTVLNNGNLTTVASFNHPNGYNNGFAPGRPNKPVDLDCNRMVHVESNKSPRPFSVASDISSKTVLNNGNLTTVASFKDPNGYNNGLTHGRPNKPVDLDCDRMVHVENNNKTPRPIFVASDSSSKPVIRNETLAAVASFKHPNSYNDGFALGRPSKSFVLDCNRMLPVEHNKIPRPDPQGLDDPVQVIAENTRDQLNNSSGFGFGSKHDDSDNVASTAARAWMSLGGATATTAAGGFTRLQSAENMNPHKQRVPVDSLYNPARHQPQTYQQPVMMVNDGQLQSRNIGFPQMVTTANLSQFQVQSGWRGLPPQMQQPSRPKQEESRRPPDLNIGYQSTGSPARQSSGMMVDSQQPDLALQL